MTSDIKWLKAKCPICLQAFKYPNSIYKPETCKNPDCIHKFLHPELNRVRR